MHTGCLDHCGAAAPSEVGVSNVYNHANKVLNIVKTLPIGVIMWGSGNIGQASISTIIKDFRQGISNDTAKFDRDKYTIENVASQLSEYIFERYNKAFSAWPNKPPLGLIVAGYSSQASGGELYQLDFPSPQGRPLKLVQSPDQSGIAWGGDVDAIHRLVMGYSAQVVPALAAAGFPAQKTLPALNVTRAAIVNEGMPIQDAIDLAGFLIETASKFSRFTPGAPTVGGPIEIATLTRHEGFKWVTIPQP